MKWIRFTILLLILTLLNSGNLLNFISLGSSNVRPDLLLIFLLFIGANCESNEAIIASFVIGFAADISGASMGPYMVSFGLFGSAVSQMRKVVLMRRMTHQALAIFVLSVIAGGLAELLGAIKLNTGTANIFSVILGTSVYSAVVGPLIWQLFSLLAGWLNVSDKQYKRQSSR
ncbi:MAG: rod shape-determining protein MreD [Sedimentisphaerales bacterium]|nr:rod shape-determining protein MreD [Sedimentisphaerales bacterium]